MDLPESVQEIAEVIGRDGALLLIGQLPRCEVKDNPAHGGKHRSGGVSSRVILYVPKKLKPNHRLVQILGEERAQKLIEGFGGETLYPANCAGVYRRWRDSEVRRMYADGATKAELAEIMQISQRHITNITRATGLPPAAND